MGLFALLVPIVDPHRSLSVSRLTDVLRLWLVDLVVVLRILLTELGDQVLLVAEGVTILFFSDFEDFLLLSDLIVVTNDSHVVALRSKHLLMDAELVRLPNLVDFLVKRHLLALLLQRNLLMIILNLGALRDLLKLLLLLIELRLGVYNVENTVGHAALVGDAAVSHFAFGLDDLVVFGLRDQGVLVWQALAVNRLLGLHARDDVATIDALPELLRKI